MNNNKKLNVIKFIAMFLSLVILAGCSASNQTKEATKKYLLNHSSEATMELTLYYEEGTDKVLRQEIKTTIKLENVDKEEISQNFEFAKNSMSIEGTDNKLNMTDKEAVIVRSADFTKVDLEKAVELGIIPDSVLSSDKKTVSLKNVDEEVTGLGYKEQK